MPMKFLDPNDPMFRRPWVRWATVLLPAAWGLFELFYVGAQFWGAIFLGASAYAGWMLFLKPKA